MRSNVFHKYSLMVCLFSTTALAQIDLCQGLVQQFTTLRHSYQGHDIEILDYSQAVSGKSRQMGGTKVVPLKSIFTDWEEETFLHIAPTGHVSVTSRKKRYDGRLLWLKRITVVDARSFSETGLFIRFKMEEGVSDEAVRDVHQAMEKFAGTKSVTCVNGACQMGEEAHVNAPGKVLPEKLLKHILSNELNWKGESIKVQFITTEPMHLDSYLTKLHFTPHKLALKGLVGAMGYGIQKLYRIVYVTVTGLAKPFTGIFLQPVEGEEKDAK